MADISVTPGSVVVGANATVESGTAGATITAGQAVYKDIADGKYKLADNDHATATIRTTRGVALNGASSGQPLGVLTDGPVTIGATLVAGTTYCLSGTPGGICPRADVTTGDEVIVIGTATSTTVLLVDVQDTGVTLA